MRAVAVTLLSRLSRADFQARVPWALVWFSVAVGLALFGIFSFNSFHSDDWNYLPYIVEINSPDPHLLDPYMGTDVDPYPRYRVNASIWGFALISRLFDADPVWLFNKAAPPILGVLSVAGAYFMLRAAGFSRTFAAVGAVIWVAYFWTSFWSNRLHGRYFFGRASQDKVILWLVVCGPTLGALLAFAREVEPLSRGTRSLRLWKSSLKKASRELSRRGRLALLCFSGLAALATFVHPLGVVFSAVFGASVVLRSAWQNRFRPSIPLTAAVLVAMIPALIWAIVLRFVMPTGSVGFELGAGFPVSGNDPGITGVAWEATGEGRRFVDIAGYIVTDPLFIGLLNFPALAWIAYRLWRGRGSMAVEIAACIYLLSSVVFLPVIPELIARLTGTPGVLRWIWVMPFAATLSLTDFAEYAWKNRANRDEKIVLGGAAAIVILLSGLLAAWNYADNTRSSEEGGPNQRQIRIYEVVERITDERADRVVVLADKDYSLYLPSYTTNVNPVFFRRFGALRETDRNGERREFAAISVQLETEFGSLVELMSFWGAELLILPQDSFLFDESVPPELRECYATTHGRLLALADSPIRCPQRPAREPAG